MKPSYDSSQEEFDKPEETKTGFPRSSSSKISLTFPWQECDFPWHFIDISTDVSLFQINWNSLSAFLTKQEGHDGPVSLQWLICEIPSYQTLQFLGTGLKHKTPNKD